MNYTYMLECADGTLYTGWTNDLQKRLAAHNSGQGAKYTRSRKPVRLVYAEKHEDRRDAMRREVEIKRLTRTQKLLLIGNELNCAFQD
ncbi:MAG: GIY-YIG nuclease family protein [Oscillospiraceae bacterium]|nr:GIY-YIG nuclease family protein [Oscillospiraceae bacterium]